MAPGRLSRYLMGLGQDRRPDTDRQLGSTETALE